MVTAGFGAREFDGASENRFGVLAILSQAGMVFRMIAVGREGLRNRDKEAIRHDFDRRKRSPLPGRILR